MDATFKTVWLSDVHLGSRACRVQLLLDFLRQTRCDTLYLVGDIIDLESLRKSFFWPTSRGVHTTASGGRLLVLHGDEFDAVIQHGLLPAFVGAAAYRSLLGLNRLVHWLHEVSGRPYWSLAQHVKARISRAQRYIATFRRASLQAAEAAGVDGIVCGHIHRAELVEHDNGLIYCNDGDWVESCTALVERSDGALELLAWRARPAVAPLAAALSDAA